MFVNRQQLTLALILAGLGTAAWWWGRPERVEAPPSASAERRPDYVVEGFRATQMDDLGRTQRHLQARILRHFPGDDSTELDAPELTWLVDQAPPWHAQAAAGRVAAEGNEIQLHGNVVLHRAASATTRAIRIETDSLRVEPQNDYAETDDPVRLYSDRDQLTSTGVRLWFGETLRIEFPKRTQAIFHMADEGRP